MEPAKHALIGGFAGGRGMGACNFSIGLGAAIAIKLPGIPDFLNFIEVQVSNEQFIFVAAGLGNNFPTRIAKIALAVKFADLPGMLGADPIDGGNKISIGDGVSGLLQLPEVLGEAGDGGGRVVNNFSAVEAKDAGTFREVAVVTNVHADAGITRLKYGITGVSGGEVKFFPETGVAMRYVVLAVFAQIASVSVDDRGGVVINTGHFDFVDRHNKRHLKFFREFLH